MAVDAPRDCAFYAKDPKQSPVVDVQEISVTEDDDMQIPNAPAIALPSNFKLRSVDARLQQRASTQLHHLNIRELNKDPELGILSQLKGTFQGDGCKSSSVKTLSGRIVNTEQHPEGYSQHG
jgi:hypothetical protein